MLYYLHIYHSNIVSSFISNHRNFDIQALETSFVGDNKIQCTNKFVLRIIALNEMIFRTYLLGHKVSFFRLNCKVSENHSTPLNKCTS